MDHPLPGRCARCITGLNLAVLFVSMQGQLCPFGREENYPVGLLVFLQVRRASWRQDVVWRPKLLYPWALVLEGALLATLSF